jgi:hypothetical protein
LDVVDDLVWSAPGVSPAVELALGAEKVCCFAIMDYLIVGARSLVGGVVEPAVGAAVLDYSAPGDTAI